MEMRYPLTRQAATGKFTMGGEELLLHAADGFFLISQ